MLKRSSPDNLIAKSMYRSIAVEENLVLNWSSPDNLVTRSIYRALFSHNHD